MRTQFARLEAIVLLRYIIVRYQKALDKESSQYILKQLIKVSNSLEEKL